MDSGFIVKKVVGRTEMNGGKNTVRIELKRREGGGRKNGEGNRMIYDYLCPPFQVHGFTNPVAKQKLKKRKKRKKRHNSKSSKGSTKLTYTVQNHI